MTLVPLPPEHGSVVELATDPGLDAQYRVGPKSLWLDTGVSPAVLRQRNAGNTAWELVGADAVSMASAHYRLYHERAASIAAKALTGSGLPGGETWTAASIVVYDQTYTWSSSDTVCTEVEQFYDDAGTLVNTVTTVHTYAADGAWASSGVPTITNAGGF